MKKHLMWRILIAVLLAGCITALFGCAAQQPGSDVTVGDNEFRLSSLPELEPFEPFTDISSRYYEEYTDRLIPSDEYGRLYYYPGQVLYSDWMNEIRYGLCDAEGRIVEIHCTYDPDSLSGSGSEASMRKVTERIIELGDKKEMVTPEDLPYIISDVLHHDNPQEEHRVRILNYSLSLAQGLKPVATLKIEINGEAYEESASGDGQYDAFVRALRRIYSRLNRPFPMLTNYSVSIPPGGRTDAFVQTVISWNYAGVDFKTRGLDADQTEAAIKATVKMLNKIEDQGF